MRCEIMRQMFLAIALLIVIAGLLVGCGPTEEAEEETTAEDTTTVTTTTTTEEGEVTDWTVTVTGTETTGEATWKVDKLVTSGEYAGLCHVIYTSTTPEGEMTMDYYFNEDGTEGYYEMEVNGQKITQEWHAEE
jgi:major membrane immunogen (membrane-anchored lipoprotein)